MLFFFITLEETFRLRRPVVDVYEMLESTIPAFYLQKAIKELKSEYYIYIYSLRKLLLLCFDCKKRLIYEYQS